MSKNHTVWFTSKFPFLWRCYLPAWHTRNTTRSSSSSCSRGCQSGTAQRQTRRTEPDTKLQRYAFDPHRVSPVTSNRSGTVSGYVSLYSRKKKKRRKKSSSLTETLLKLLASSLNLHDTTLTDTGCSFVCMST